MGTHVVIHRGEILTQHTIITGQRLWPKAFLNCWRERASTAVQIRKRIGRAAVGCGSVYEEDLEYLMHSSLDSDGERAIEGK